MEIVLIHHHKIPLRRKQRRLRLLQGNLKEDGRTQLEIWKLGNRNPPIRIQSLTLYRARKKYNIIMRLFTRMIKIFKMRWNIHLLT